MPKTPHSSLNPSMFISGNTFLEVVGEPVVPYLLGFGDGAVDSVGAADLYTNPIAARSSDNGCGHAERRGAREKLAGLPLRRADNHARRALGEQRRRDAVGGSRRVDGNVGAAAT